MRVTQWQQGEGDGEGYVKEEAHGETYIHRRRGLLSTKLAHNKNIHPFLRVPPPNSLTLEIKFLTHEAGDVGKP